VAVEVPPELDKAFPGALGAILAFPFLTGTLLMRLAMVAGGVAVSWWGTPHLAAYMEVVNADRLLGFLLGLLAMSVVAKVFELLHALRADSVIGTLLDWLKKRLGV
jgi:hypothetical protein